MAAVDAHAGSTVLDIGCGSGAYVLEGSQHRTIFGIDRQRFPTWSGSPGRFAIMDATQLGAIRDDAVDTVLLFEVIEHLDDPGALLREARRIARKNIIISVPNTELSEGMTSSRLIYYHWIDRTHVNFFTTASLRLLVEGTGCSVSHIETINAISLAPLFAEALAAPRIARLIDRVLRWRQREPYCMTLLMVADVT